MPEEIEVPTEHLHETIHEAAEGHHSHMAGFNMQVALSTAILAVVAAVSALLAGHAANEAVRMASPVRSFARHVSRDAKVGDVRIPEGARVMMQFASANRDHRVFEDPDRFDITRHPRHHLGFGRGIHMCVGEHLAQMEMIALLEAIPLLAQEGVELTGIEMQHPGKLFSLA